MNAVISRSAAGPPSRPDQPLWRDRRFSVFWASQTLSVAGDSFALIAVPLLVLRVTGSVAQMGLLTAASGVASVGAGVFAGVLTDRVDRRALLIACDLTRMALYGMIPLAWMAGLGVWPLFLLLPAAEAVGMVFQVGYVAAVRNLVGGERVTEANGRLFATAALAGTAGPLLAGVVSGRFGPVAAITADAVSFAASAGGLSLIRLSSAAAAVREGTKRAVTWRELTAGARFLWAHPVLRALTISLSFFIFLTAGLTDVLIYHLRQELGLPDALVGTVLAAGAAGSAVGGLLTPALRRRFSFSACWTGAVSVSALAIAVVGAARGTVLIGGLAGCYLAATSVAGICSMSLRQQVTPDHLLGRVTSAFWTIHYSLGPLGAAALTWAAQRFGAAAACLAAGLGCLLIAAAALASPLREREQASATADPESA